MNAAAGGGGGGADQPWTTLCTVVGADTTDFSYGACSACERPLPSDAASDSNAPCGFCSRKTFAPAPTRFFRLLLSVATDERVMVVVCFDRAARVLLGCSAAELFAFCRAHPSAAEEAGDMLEGEMCCVTLSRPRNGNAQHLRVVSVAPLRTGFRPVMQRLRMVYGVGSSTSK